VKPPRALLVNPYIYDVSAYNVWSAPLGLLYVGSVLRENGFEIELVDCMVVDEKKRKADGRGPFVKEKAEPARALRGLGKRFKRYGLGPRELKGRLESLEEPDIVLVTCIMTHWYVGAQEVVALVREVYPRARVALGGVYASLCEEHARAHVGADLVVGSGGLGEFYAWAERVTGRSPGIAPAVFSGLPYPCFDLYEKREFVPVLGSVGCVYRCSYCATPFLHPRIEERTAGKMIREIAHWHHEGAKRFVLYDDAFLVGREGRAKPFLRGVTELPFATSFYNPNAVHAALVDEETAVLLRAAGFEEVRLGFESVDGGVQRATGGKVDTEGFERAVGFLKAAGFDGSRIGAYVLAGLPGQAWQDVQGSIEYLGGLKVRVHLAEYSPVAQTALFERHHMDARYPIKEEPLFHNKALFPFSWEGFTEEHLQELKRQVLEQNGALEGRSGYKGSGTAKAGFVKEEQ
jgi:radical SAM superfamily enzyme YgiQ (UPF0313 family)